ncbi:MAG TPA: hypothetical protein VGQ44_10595 [Gemmatimonadaceae bacterium]|jgi:hypothetical protein|nr:hypothetical protein [Gemmatimonadaceae bacterium]
MSPRRPFLFIALLLSIAGGPVLSWAQVTTLPAAPGTVVQQGAAAPAVPARVKAPTAAAASDLPLLALLGLGLLITGAGMVTSIRPSRQRA